MTPWRRLELAPWLNLFALLDTARAFLVATRACLAWPVDLNS
jgi:hypothetical protein